MSEVTIFEVGPRDGLQNEKDFIDTQIKVELINRLAEAGIKKIEATSFVSPKWVPQMADAGEVMQSISRQKGVVYSALTPNLRGMEAALEANVDEVAVFAAASEEFSHKNINCTVAESLARFEPVMEMARANDIPVRGYVSCVVHCPYEGKVAPEKTATVNKALMEMGCYEVSLGDTIGKGHPIEFRDLLELLLADYPADRIALHCHDTYNRALANIEVGLDMDVRTFDSSIAGLGGCPYAEGASGNVSTEAVVSMVHEKGFSTGIDLDKLNDVSQFVSQHIKRN